MGLIVVDLEYVAIHSAVYCQIRGFCLFSRVFSRAKKPDFDRSRKFCS